MQVIDRQAKGGCSSCLGPRRHGSSVQLRLSQDLRQLIYNKRHAEMSCTNDSVSVSSHGIDEPCRIPPMSCMELCRHGNPAELDGACAASLANRKVFDMLGQRPVEARLEGRSLQISPSKSVNFGCSTSARSSFRAPCRSPNTMATSMPKCMFCGHL